MIEICSNPDWDVFINQKKLEKILKVFLKNLFKNERGLSLYLTNDTEIQELNLEFRGKDSPTDILSWPYDEDEENFCLPKEAYTDEVLLAGDLVVSAEHAQKQAVEYGWDFETELIRLLAHGCTHLAGWDHERSTEEARSMLELEISLLNEVGLFNIY
jgi:probable rRNA maturation factor